MTSIAFVLLAVVLLPLWFITGVVLACFKSTRTAGLVLLSTSVIVPLAGFFVLFSFHSVPTQAPGAIEVSASANPPIRQPPPDLPPPAPPASIPDENNLPPATSAAQKGLIDKFSAEAAQLVNKWSRIFAESMAAERKQNDAAAPASDGPPKATAAFTPNESPGAKPRPGWVGKAPRAEGDIYQTCVTVGPYLDLQECKENRLRELQKAFNNYVVNCLGSQWAERIRPSDKELFALDTKEYEETVLSPTLGKMKNLHLLVKIDRRQVEAAQRRWIVHAHLRQAGAGLAGLWLALGVLWSYLRLDQRSNGRYRRRLRLAAAEDLVQETFIGFLTSLPNFDRRRPLESYLFSIAAHKLTDYLRREGRRPALPLVPGGSSGSDWEPAGSARVASSIARSGERRRLEEDALVAALTDQIEQWRSKGAWDKLQSAELLFVRGWSNKETAQRLGLSEQTVANYKFECLAKLRAAVRSQGLPEEVFPELYEEKE
jgi:RNA polymerase sigma-70 factor (ECF subfamily)